MEKNTHLRGLQIDIEAERAKSRKLDALCIKKGKKLAKMNFARNSQLSLLKRQVGSLGSSARGVCLADAGFRAPWA